MVGLGRERNSHLCIGVAADEGVHIVPAHIHCVLLPTSSPEERALETQTTQSAPNPTPSSLALTPHAPRHPTPIRHPSEIMRGELSEWFAPAYQGGARQRCGGTARAHARSTSARHAAQAARAPARLRARSSQPAMLQGKGLSPRILALIRFT